MAGPQVLPLLALRDAVEEDVTKEGFMVLCDVCLKQMPEQSKMEFVWGRGGSSPLQRTECCKGCAELLSEYVSRQIVTMRQGVDLSKDLGLTPDQAAKVRARYGK
jgi:hypothetical protein